MNVEMKNRSYRYDINRTRPRHGYKMCLNLMMVICNRQHLSNISRIHEIMKKCCVCSEQTKNDFL